MFSIFDRPTTPRYTSFRVLSAGGAITIILFTSFPDMYKFLDVKQADLQCNQILKRDFVSVFIGFHILYNGYYYNPKLL